jgi:hypothetical protein
VEFNIISWNACGLEVGAINDVVLMLENIRWDALLLQEGPLMGPGGTFSINGGHTFFVSASVSSHRPVCFFFASEMERLQDQVLPVGDAHGLC